MSLVPRLFLPGLSKDQTEITLDGPLSRYLVRVLRLEEGQTFRAFNSRGLQCDLVLKRADPLGAVGAVSSRKEDGGPAGVHIALGQSLPKGAKMDLILREGTEVGVHRFVPIVTQRSISRPEPSQFEHKGQRWRKILVEACRQCGRNDVPSLDPVRSWEETLELFPQFDRVLVPYEKEAPTLKTVLEAGPPAFRLLLLIGPEGGWAQEEIRTAEEKGAFPVHLPTPILRTETAGVAVVSMFQYFLSQTRDGPP
jgi:16S rRNA (uracil1498-N3)-methyltransferase